MRPARVPSIATWFLKLFCSSTEHEAVIGDLSEQYQSGRGRFWYWRQVLAIVFLRIYREAPRVMFATNVARVRQAFALIFVATALSTVLLTEIWPLFVVGILGGGIAGGLMLLRGGARSDTSATDLAPSHPGISINHIPAEGPVGLLFVLATVLIFGGGVPAVRALIVVTLPLGLIGLGILFYWHKHHPVEIQALHLDDAKEL